MQNKAIILIGPESSGNHVFCSLFSKMKINCKKLIGTDLCGWEDNKPKTHLDELMNNIWNPNRNPQELIRNYADNDFVTSRSIPCGSNFPDVISFITGCKREGFDPYVVIISREMNILIKSLQNRNMSLNVRYNNGFIYRICETMKCKYSYISYDCLIQHKQYYFRSWLNNIEYFKDFTIEENWFSFIEDKNRRYIDGS